MQDGVKCLHILRHTLTWLEDGRAGDEEVRTGILDFLHVVEGNTTIDADVQREAERVRTLPEGTDLLDRIRDQLLTPGLTDMMSTRSSIGRTQSRVLIGVAGFSATPALRPRSRIC